MAMAEAEAKNELGAGASGFKPEVTCPWLDKFINLTVTRRGAQQKSPDPGYYSEQFSSRRFQGRRPRSSRQFGSFDYLRSCV